jgi:hypothetical protein
MMPLPQLRSFALWLPKHAALVNSITARIVYLHPTEDVHGLPCDSHVDEVQRVLGQALQLAGAMPAPPTAAVPSATAAVPASSGGHTALQQRQQQQQQQQQLSLRKLEMNMRGSYRITDQPMPVLDIKHLTTLEELCSCWWSWPGQLPEGSALPTQLKQLQLAHCSARDLAAVMPLLHLQRLNVVVDTDTAGEVARLAQLPALPHLALRYQTLRLAVATAHVWRQLPHLHELRVEDDGDDYDSGTVQQMQSVLAGIAAATGLTYLHLSTASLTSPQMSFGIMADIVVCPRLAGLSRFKKLYMRSLMRASNPHDLRALTAITGLTHLDLACSRNLVATDSATALARSLTRLRHLDVGDCQVDLGSSHLILALGQLTQLTRLDVTGWGDNKLSVGGLMQLTGLRHLEDLRVPRSAEITEEVLRVFWEKVRGR